MTVIQVENLSKYYRLGVIGSGSLREDVNHYWTKLRGREEFAHNKQIHSETSNRDKTRIWALKDINLTVREGEILGIIGGNGAGKSTLLKIISRITAPTEGKIKIRGRVGSLLEVGTGFHPELTGRENVYLNGTILGMTRQEVSRKLDEIIDFAETGAFIDTPVKRYSSGMIVRLAFAVAAHLEPEILIVDEVLAVGDAAFQKKCLGKMNEVGKEGRTVLFVSHNMSAIRQLCGSAVLLKSGEIFETGSSEKVTESYLSEMLTKYSSDQDSRPPGYIYYRDPKGIAEDFAITAVQLLDVNDKEVDDVGTWDFVKIRLHFHSRKTVNRASVEVKIQSKENVPLLYCSTQPDSDIPYKIKPGTHFVDCVFDKWPLTKGSYVLGAGLGMPMVDYLCWDDSLCELHTAGRDIYSSGKIPTADRYIVAPTYHWNIP